MPASWIHDLRNAINTVCTNAAVVRMLLEQGETARAQLYNAEILKACERSSNLLDQYSGEADPGEGG